MLFEAVGTNVVASFDQVVGDVEAAIREADVVVRETFDVQRHTAVPMETRGVVAEWARPSTDPGGPGLMLRVTRDQKLTTAITGSYRRPLW